MTTERNNPTPSTTVATEERKFVNLAAYHFVRLDELPRRRQALQELVRELEMKGTILLAPEGINLFVSGTREATDALLRFLADDPAFTGLEVKESFSEEIAFNRMLVKIKEEIIAFGVESANPLEQEAPRLEAETLKQWLDENRELILLDVRNDFEFEVGTFENAERIGVDSFRAFPEKINDLPQEWRNKTIVTFCTGGIRCEKAAPLMQQAGFEDVYQLDGGILKYFEVCGDAYYDGDCFVFDRRVAVDAQLAETDKSLCFACQRVLTADDRESELFVEGVSCPFCAEDREKQRHWWMKRRRRSLKQFQQELPGSKPYQNVRPLNLPERVHGMRLIEALRELFPHDPPEAWQERIESGRLRHGERLMEADDRVVAGLSLLHFEPDVTEPDVASSIEILDEDAYWIVVNKPAPLPVHPCGRFRRNTLTWMLSRLDRGSRLRPSHRLDANTTGVQILCKDRDAARQVQEQFEHNRVKKTYLAHVAGQPDWDEYTCEAPISEAAGASGVRLIDAAGKAAKTTFRVISREHDGSCLIEAQPLTGRTNQIRLHLWHCGFPILGDPIYLASGQLGTSQTLPLDAAPMRLHAWRLELLHPHYQTTERIEAPLPAWSINVEYQLG